jgi:peptidoglycan pentaglycine glycine transferase (the first glycine)
METLKSTTGHLLQSAAWGQLKSQFGWQSTRIESGEAVAQILFRQLPLGVTLAYIPKGPTGNWADLDTCGQLFEQVHHEAKRRRAIFLKVEPDIQLPASQDQTTVLTQCGFTPADSIQPETSIVIDISDDEDMILAAMKQKSRYNIRLARRKEVTIREGDETDLPLFHGLAQETATRDGFGVHSQAYYRAAYQLFAPDQCALLFAEFQGQPLAALMVFRHQQQAYYFYGASSNIHRNLMPTYLLQWEAIRWAKKHDCTTYDLWGVPNAPAEVLEAEFTNRSDGLWGVYRFKRGFGGKIVHSAGAFDYVYNPLLYQIYRVYRRM